MPRRFLLSHTITPETKAAHRVRWFGRTTPGSEYPDGYVPRNKWMKGRDWGWDVKCSCGWATHTGGAIEASIQEEIDEHRYHAQFEAEHCLTTKGGLICLLPKGHEDRRHGAKSALTHEWIEWD